MNSNPETVSTDYDTSSRLYFEPLTIEDVLNVIEKERPEGIIIQFGGQTPLKLANGIQKYLEDKPLKAASGVCLCFLMPACLLLCCMYCCAVLCCAVLCCAGLGWAGLGWAVLVFTVLYSSLLCCAVLCCCVGSNGIDVPSAASAAPVLFCQSPTALLVVLVT